MTAPILAASFARLLLASVFGAAGIGKLLDPGGAGRAVRAFGAPGRLALPLALLLAVAELAVGVGLLVPVTAWWAAVGAMLLLGLFSLAVARAMRRGETPDCQCFGRLHSARVGRGTLVRNALLGGIAALIVVHPPGATGGLSWAAVAVAAAVGAAVLATWLVVELLRRNGRLLARIDQLEQALSDPGLALPEHSAALPGQPAPFFALSDPDGRPVTSTDLLAPGRRLVLLFASPTCGPCRVALRRLAAWQRDEPETTVAVIGEGTAEAWRALPVELRPEGLLLQHDREVADRYGVDVTPTAVTIAADGTVAGPPAVGAAEVCALFAPVEADTSQPDRPTAMVGPLLVQPIGATR